jgi:hypothetical protein
VPAASAVTKVTALRIFAVRFMVCFLFINAAQVP